MLRSKAKDFQSIESRQSDLRSLVLHIENNWVEDFSIVTKGAFEKLAI
jgi:hypothetical protein